MRKPKSSASLLNDALRMKCCIFLSASQIMMTVWSALTTGLPEGGAGQQPSTGSVIRIARTRALGKVKDRQVRIDMDSPPAWGIGSLLLYARRSGFVEEIED